MSEFVQNASLVLGIAGTLIGAFALFISWWTFKKDRPHLKVNVTDCTHDFAVSQSVPNKKSVCFLADFLIKNVGYRGTTIEDIELTFENNGKPYKIRKQFYREQFLHEKDIPVFLKEMIPISPSKSFNLSAKFYEEEFIGNEVDKINCTFTIFHTYKALTVKYVSVRKPPIKEI